MRLNFKHFYCVFYNLLDVFQRIDTFLFNQCFSALFKSILLFLGCNFLAAKDNVHNAQEIFLRKLAIAHEKLLVFILTLKCQTLLFCPFGNDCLIFSISFFSIQEEAIFENFFSLLSHRDISVLATLITSFKE